MKTRSKRRLCDILLDAGIVDAAHIEKALERQKLHPGRLGSHLLRMKFISEDTLAKALAIQYDTDPFFPSENKLDKTALEKISRDSAKRLAIFPYKWDAGAVLHIAAAEPDNLASIDEIRFASGARRVKVKAAPESVIERLIAKYYDGVEETAVFAPTVVQTAPTTDRQTDRPGETGKQTRQKHHKSKNALIADPDYKRRRGLSAILEHEGYQVSKADSKQDLVVALEREEWKSVWVHRSLAEGEDENQLSACTKGHFRIYENLAASLCGQIDFHDHTMEQAKKLAELAAGLSKSANLEKVREAVSMVKFLAGRKGITGAAADCLELCAWNAGLTGWQLIEKKYPSIPGKEILVASATYQRALIKGKTHSQAAEAVRRDKSLDPDAATSLIKWVVGSDLLEKMEINRRLLAVFSSGEAPENILSNLADSGWSVEIGNTSDIEHNGWDAVLASYEAGLKFLEHSDRNNKDSHPPIFLVAESPSEPQTMYALKMDAEDVFHPDTHPEVVAAKIERAAKRKKTDDNAVSGDLKDMALADMLQILSNGLKTAAIKIAGPKKSGMVCLDKGQIVHAVAGDKEGEEALYELIAFAEGTFRMEPIVEGKTTINAFSTDSLLMEGFRRLDEARKTPDK